MPSIPAGSTGTFSFSKFADFAVYEIAFTANVNMENAKLTVKEARLSDTTKKPFEAGREAAYTYLSVTREKVKNEEISNAKIRFKVPNSWLNAESVIPGSVVLKKLVSGEWEPRQTRLAVTEGSYTLYEADIEGMSTFAVVGTKSIAQQLAKPEEKEEEKAEAGGAGKPAEGSSAAARQTQEEQGKNEATGLMEKLKEKVGNLGFAAKAVWMLVVIVTGILVYIEAMHFLHRKIPKLGFRMPKIPPPPTS